MGLTPCQLEAGAVEEPPRDTCVVAGPGSGKTTVLVAHFERLVESGVDPLRILAITFTDKAANNIRDRLASTFGDRTEIRAKLERHLAECPNCWVICDTTKKTIEIYRDSQLYELPEDLRTRLRTAIVSKCHSRKKSGPEHV